MMKRRKIETSRKLYLLPVLGVLAAGAWAAWSSTSEAGTMPTRRGDSPPKPRVNSKRVMTRPEGYRGWIYIGTPLTPNETNPPEAPFPEFHNVYIHPDDFAHYERTGEFADGTVIVKELVSIGTKQATSGKGYFMGEFIGLEAAIKDSRQFGDQPGHWAYYSFGHSYPLKDAAEPRPKESCNVCHGVNADQDWVFTQYYPVLRAAQPSR